MNNLFEMIWVEQRKAWRSRVPVFTFFGSLIMPLAIGLLIFLAKHPELTKKLGLLSAKANLAEFFATDWTTYLGFTGQIVATGGFFLFTFAVSWVFGREFADGTLKEMLAVPVPRLTILLAKFVVVVGWSVTLSVVILISSLVVGGMINLPQASFAVIFRGTTLAAITACLVIPTVLPFALLASMGRGYLLPMGFVLLALLSANLVVVLGWGEYFPWSVPALFSQDPSMPAASYWIVILTGLAGMLATYTWWMRADQSR